MMIGLAAVPGPKEKAHLIEGGSLTAALVAIHDGKEAIFERDGSRQSVKLNGLTVWGAAAEPTQGPVVILPDDGLIAARSVQWNDDRIRIENACFGKLDLPSDAVAGIIFDWPSDPSRRDRLRDRILDTQKPTDRVFLTNGDVLEGILVGIDRDDLVLQYNSGDVRLSRERVVAVSLDPTLRIKRDPSERTAIWTGWKDGTLVAVDRIESVLSRLRVRFPWGEQADVAVGDLRLLQSSGIPRVVFLSDLKPIKEEQVPFLSVHRPSRADRNVLGERLRVGSRIHRKGIGVHAGSRLTYRLDQPYGRFEAEAALDRAAGEKGSVRFLVFVDEQLKYKSGVIRGADRPESISVDLTGAKQLDLMVEAADRLDQLDRADWLGARLISSPKEIKKKE